MQDCWKIAGKNIEIAIGRTNGLPEAFFLKDKGLELFQGGLCNLFIEDRTAGKTYDALAEKAVVSKIRRAKNSLCLELGYDRAPFKVTVSYAIAGDALKWNAVLAGDGRDREIHVGFSFPWCRPEFQFFMPHDQAHFSFKEIAGRYYYNYYQKNEPEPVSSTELEIGTPSFTAYDGARDYGISVLAPFDAVIPRLTVDFEKQSGRITITNRHLRLGPDCGITGSVFIVPHEGDWRPALGWMLKKYPGYFEPVNKKVFDCEGSMLMGLFDSRESIRKRREKEGLAWTEVHHHFPRYGEYLPEKEEWINYGAVGDRGKPRKVSKGMIKDYLRMLKEEGVAGVMYFQIFDCDTELAEKEFPESIVKDYSGNPLSCWPLTCIMNPDPDLPWGKYLLSQIKKMIKTYPQAAGFFIDVYSHREFDFSRDDGVSMRMGKRCYMIRHAHKRIMKKISKIIHAAGKFMWVNGLGFIDAGRGVDGNMAEGGGLAWMSFLSSVRPQIYLGWISDPAPMEKVFQSCLKYGTLPPVSGEQVDVLYQRKKYSPPTGKMTLLFEKYLPLFERLKGKRWVLTAHALKLPAGLDGNIFKNGRGEYVVAIVSEGKSALSGETFAENVKVTARLPGKITGVKLISADYRGEMELDFEKKAGGYVELMVPKHRSASVIVMK